MAKEYERTSQRSNSSQAHADSDNVSSGASMMPPSQMKLGTSQLQKAPDDEKPPSQLKAGEKKKGEIQMKSDSFALPEKEEK